MALATDMFDGKTRTNWVTSHFYPEVTGSATFDSRRVSGFEHKSQIVDVVAAMLERGYEQQTVEKILGQNWMRVLSQVWH